MTSRGAVPGSAVVKQEENISRETSQGLGKREEQHTGQLFPSMQHRSEKECFSNLLWHLWQSEEQHRYSSMPKWRDNSKRNHWTEYGNLSLQTRTSPLTFFELVWRRLEAMILLSVFPSIMWFFATNGSALQHQDTAQHRERITPAAVRAKQGSLQSQETNGLWTDHSG